MLDDLSPRRFVRQIRRRKAREGALFCFWEAGRGAMGIRTPDLLNAIEALYQLSYDPLNEEEVKHPGMRLAIWKRGRMQRPAEPAGPTAGK